MIRGPVLPLVREGLWRIVQQHPEWFEHGLKLVVEGLDLGSDGLGRVDGLMRDARGGPVLVFTTDPNDSALPARIVAAHGFWARNAAGMSRALPEAALRCGQRCRLLVIGTGLSTAVDEALRRLQLAELEVVEVDRFQVGGQDRLVLRPVHGQPGGSGPPPIDATVAEQERAVFAAFDAFVQKIDPKIRVDGDRFSRRASLEGRALGECWFADDRVLGLVTGQPPQPLESDDDLRALVDRIARRYLAILAGPAGKPAVPAPAAVPPRAGGLASLRASVHAAARLSDEEFHALGTAGGPDDVGEHPHQQEQSAGDS